MSYLTRLAVVMGPVFLINEECNFAYAMVWVVACWMILLSLSERVWMRR